MKLKEKPVTVNVHEIFKAATNYRFNCLCLNTAFKHDLTGLIIGGEDGIIRIYDMSKPVNIDQPQILLETKGGPIQTIAVHDVTKFYHNDVVVGDSHGTVTVFCNQQILCRHSLARDNIRGLQIHTDQVGNSSIITSDESGFICALLPSKELWRLNLNNMAITKSVPHRTLVTSMLSAELVTPNGERCSYILAADDTKHLHLLHQGSIVMTMDTPTVITAMCSGMFLDPDKLETGPDTPTRKDHPQVALGSSSGAIYILHSFTITEEEFANAKYHITHLHSHPSSRGSGINGAGTTTTHNTPALDYLLCSGHFNALHVYYEGKKVGNYVTPDWVTDMDFWTAEKGGKPQLVVGCLDNTVLGLSLQET